MADGLVSPADYQAILLYGLPPRPAYLSSRPADLARHPVRSWPLDCGAPEPDSLEAQSRLPTPPGT